jgi:hypothetical protein
LLCQTVENHPDLDLSAIRKRILTTVGVVDFSDYFGPSNVELEEEKA